MASSQGYLEFILEQLSDAGDIAWRAMTGEYILYYRGKVIGGIYDDRFLVKPVPALMPDAAWEAPYEGAKPMLLVDRVEGRAFLKRLAPKFHSSMPLPTVSISTGALAPRISARSAATYRKTTWTLALPLSMYSLPFSLASA